MCGFRPLGAISCVLCLASHAWASAPPWRTAPRVSLGPIKIVNPNPGTEDFFGQAIDASDGLLVVGAPWSDRHAPDGGTAYVYSGATLIAELVPPTLEAGALFGMSVAISGRWLAVGSSRAGGVGAVDIFERVNASTWNFVARVFGPGVTLTGEFGSAVALDGDALIVGAPWDGQFGAAIGSVHLFEFDLGAWSHRASIEPPGVPNGALFGRSVDIEGDVAIAGAPYVGVSFLGGDSFLIRRSGPTWELAERLERPWLATGRSRLGAEVALSAGRALVGAPRDTPPATGFVGLYSTRGAAPLLWTEVSPVAIPFDRFGAGVAMQGSLGAVGSPTNGEAGRVAVFSISPDGTMLPFLDITPPDGAAFDHFGARLRLDGGRLWVSAHFHDAGATDAGAVYLYSTHVQSGVRSP